MMADAQLKGFGNNKNSQYWFQTFSLNHHPVFTLNFYLLGVWGGVQGAAVVLGMHHGHIRATVIQHLLHAVHAAALATRADRGAGNRVVAAQAVHLTAGCLAVLQVRTTYTRVQKHTQGIYKNHP